MLSGGLWLDLRLSNLRESLFSAKKEKEEIAYLRQRDTTKEDAISELSDQLMRLTREVQQLKSYSKE
jgi:hypothetical protein